MKNLIKSTRINLLILSAIILLFSSGTTLKAQAIFGYDYGTGTGSVNSGTGTSFFSPSPNPGTFFYGFSSTGSTLTAANPGLLNLGTYTEAQCQAGASGQFSKFGVMAYAPSNNKTSYNKFDVILAGSDGVTPSNSGVWYFCAGDGGNNQKFMYNNTKPINVQETSTTLRWTFGNDSLLTLAYYDNSLSWVDIGPYKQGTRYSIEIFSNLGSASVEYFKGAVRYICAQNKQDIWINDIIVKHQVNVASTSNQLVKIDSYCFYGSGSNSAYLFTDDATYSQNITGDSSRAYYSHSSGDLNSLSTWGTKLDGSGPAPANFSNPNCTYYIRNNPAPTISGNWTVSGLDSRVVVGDGTNPCNFTIPSGFTYSGAVVDVTNNGTLTLQNLTVPTLGILATGSTVEYAAGSAQIIPASPDTYYNLTINNSSGVTLGSSLIVNNTLALTLGQLSIANNTLTLNNAISGTGTLTGGSTANLVIGDDGSAANLTLPLITNGLQDLTVNRANGITLGSSLTTSRNLTMILGNITTGANVLTLGTSPLSLGTLTYTSGNIIGSFKRWFANTTVPNVLFPVGTSINSNMITLSFTGAPATGGSLTAKFVVGDPGTNNSTAPVIDGVYIVDSYSAVGCWQIDANDGLIGGTYNLSLLGQGFTGISSTNYPLLRLLKRPSPINDWIVDGAHAPATGSSTLPTIKRTGLSGFSQFAMGGNIADGNPLSGVLPVELLSFTSNVSERNVKLNWTTASEQNNAGFEVLRSLQNDNVNWVKVGYVTGSGTKTTPTNYSFEDINLNTGKYSYKLKQVDYNGNFEYFVMSGIAEIGSPKKFDLLQNYPNPFNPITKIDYQLPDNGKVRIIIYDMLGKEVKNLVNETKSTGYYSVAFDASSLASGVYIYRLSFEGNGNNFNVTKRMTLIK